ncbi:hypothetical protein MXB_190 [Myxobolus squamalis]|nr:hypothetical protein MXB_190 [Myxobolus squamalis]
MQILPISLVESVQRDLCERMVGVKRRLNKIKATLNQDDDIDKRRPGDTPIHKRDIDHVPKLTYAESQRLVDIEHNNTYHRLAIEDSLEMIRTEPIPTAEYCIKDEYGIITYENPILTRSSYFRPYENFEQVMADNVEYEMDEEDVAWLNYINSNFLKNKETVQAAEFEYILDRLEKESEFIVKNTDGSLPGAVEEDVVCAICLDGDCSNNNLIVFCDICNTPVHQDCYGLPYVPEGQWLCRRCSHAPSLEIECALCSIKNGVFKQTTDGRWCHVICAIMIPGAKFINTVFLEPIDLSDISSSRFNVRCKICCQIKGAVIQCVFHQCTIPFHVSCAQSSGLLFVEKNEVSTNDDSGLPLINHRYLPYCSKHCPSTNVSKTVNLSISAVKNTTSPATIHVPIVLESLLQQLASDTNVLVKSLTSGLPELEEYVYPDQNRIKINSLVWAHLGKVKYFPGRVLQIKVEQQLSTTTNSDEEQSEVVNIHKKTFYCWELAEK